MNHRIIAQVLSRVMFLQAALMLPCILVAFHYRESAFALAISLLVALAFGAFLSLFKPKRTDLYARDGFVSVSLSWILMSVVGALPFVISGAIPSFFDAFFETVSGFTTTGSSIIPNVEHIDKSLLLWRSTTQWIGGMGVLVFIMAVLPLSDHCSIHLMRAEVPGPVFGKVVPKMRTQSAISYLIYIGLTVLLIIMLVLGKMPFFDAVNHALTTASTGGYSTKALSVGHFNSAYIEIVIGVFMLLFGANFSIYFLMLMRKFKAAFTNTEVLTYIGLAGFAWITIAINIQRLYGDFATSLRHSFFQVSSLMTSTGFSSVNFDVWPAYSKWMLIILMFIGACSSSTGGGIKVSRMIMIVKGIRQEILKMLNPRSTVPVRVNGYTIDKQTVHSAFVFFAIYLIVTFVAATFVTIDGFDAETSLSAAVACISNIGPGLGAVGPAVNFSGLSDLSKLILSFTMLIGRLEIFPVFILFLPRTWRKSL
ncbi:MAG: TrkH family potassium uptake protein [Ruminococcaceae bacterium]|nr:TrkH family potassium uptake protein [Oscillospiraceae bacterium]